MNIEHQLGEISGRLQGIEGHVERIESDLREHKRSHRQGWQWAVPTVLVLINLVVAAVQAWRG